jgi:RNA polymerase sigma factor (sigma-70 family)
MLRATNAAAVVAIEPAQEHAAARASEHLNESARQALQENPLAVRQFLRAIAPTVRRICRGVMGRDSLELEDTIQDCMIDVVRALPQFRFEASVSHYVTKIAMRRAIASRQRARARSKQCTGMDSQILRMASADGVADAHADLVRSLLDRLSEAQATALLLRHMLGHSVGEIACITGVSENTVKTRLRLGKNQLRRWLARRGEGCRAGS